MSLLYSVTELMATLVENIVVLSAVTQMSGNKHRGKKKVFCILGISFIMMLMISWLNSLEAFSFLTIGICVCFVTTSTKFTSKSGLLQRLTATVITYLVVHAVDYLVLFAFGFALELPVDDFHTFDFLMQPSLDRCLFLAVDKLIDVILYFLLRKALMTILNLGRKHCAVVFTISSLAYLVMSILLSLIFIESIFIMQTAVMLSWAFLVICVALAVAAFVLITNYQQEQNTNLLLRTTNELMTKNYQQINDSKRIVDKNIHDFYKHLSVIRDYALNKKENSLIEYLDSLLKTPYRGLPLCTSGNDVIDSIINCKAAEAKESKISFRYNVDVTALKGIDPVDICTILANQIDNAFEASLRIPDTEQRDVEVKIWMQTKQIVFFQVSNLVLEDPFYNNSTLASTKKDKDYPHGLGILSIQSSAEKYHGELKSICHNNRFTSTVFLCHESSATDSV